MSTNPRIIKAIPANVTDLLQRLRSTWPAPDSAQSPGLTFEKWHAEAHDEIENGLFVLAASHWDEGEESVVREFPALEFRELEESVQNLVSRQYTSRFNVPTLTSLAPSLCQLALDKIRRRQTLPLCAKVMINVQLDLLSARLCTTHNNGEYTYAVPFYLHFVDSTGWGRFRKYLWESITNQWDCLSVKQQYEVLKDLCKLRMLRGHEDSIQTESEDDFTPKSLWEYLETDYELAQDSDENPMDEKQYYHCPALATVLSNEFRLRRVAFPALIPGSPPPPAPALPSSSRRQSGPTRRSRSPPRRENDGTHRQPRSPPPPPRRSHSLAHLSQRKLALYSSRF